MMFKVSSYDATTYGLRQTFQFTEVHAMEAGVDFYPDGIPYSAAEKLCQKWNQQSKLYNSMRHSYAVFTINGSI